MDIKIGKSAHACVVCGSSFEHEQAVTSSLQPGDEELVRSDYCEKCWDAESAAHVYSVWSGQFYDPDVAEQGPEESYSPLRRTFYDAVESDDRTVMAMAYLAAQLLRRQKVFRLIKESKDPDTDAAVVLFSDRVDNRLIEVKDPCLSYAELEEGRRLLMERLNELEVPASEEGVEDGQNEDQYAQI